MERLSAPVDKPVERRASRCETTRSLCTEIVEFRANCGCPKTAIQRGFACTRKRRLSSRPGHVGGVSASPVWSKTVAAGGEDQAASLGSPMDPSLATPVVSARRWRPVRKIAAGLRAFSIFRQRRRIAPLCADRGVAGEEALVVPMALWAVGSGGSEDPERRRPSGCRAGLRAGGFVPRRLSRHSRPLCGGCVSPREPDPGPLGYAVGVAERVPATSFGSGCNR